MREAIPPDRMVWLQQVSDAGLSDPEVGISRRRFGDNIIAERAPRSHLAILREAATDPMIWFLLVTSSLFAVVGQGLDAAVLSLAIVPILGMDFYLHRRTQVSTEALGSVLATTAEVIRGGRTTRVPSAELVVGDLVQVHAGEAFPADGIVLSSEGMAQVDESSLTGESFPVSKLPFKGTGDPADESRAYAGTRLLSGNARIHIFQVGRDTAYGEIVNLIVEPPGHRTPLQRIVFSLVKVLLWGALGFCLLLAAVRVMQGYGLLDALMSAAVLAVAAIPEEFPVVLTFFLGVGVYRLARRKALVRNATAVENIGRTTAICTDKTGTITEGHLRISETIPAFGTSATNLLQLAALATEQATHDPLDLVIVQQAGPQQAGWLRLREFPFTEDRRRATAFWKSPEGSLLAALKGAPETVLGACELDPVEAGKWSRKVHALSRQGKKVIACAFRTMEQVTEDEPWKGFRMAGLLAITDPVRPGVSQAIAQARAAGIQVVMITGDHPETAAAIAREVGLDENPATLTGDSLEAELAQMDTAALGRLSVIARAAPAQKVIAVKALQAAGRVVAVTGDGVNDAPALRAADIGIAMGIRGTRSAREVSHIVLMDDNFATIIAAIAEGRALFSNLRLSFAFLLMVHFQLVVTAALVPLAGYPLLYLPIHIVWLEMIIHPAAILGFQRSVQATLDRSMPGPVSFFAPSEWLAIMATAVVSTGLLAAVILYTLRTVAHPAVAPNMASSVALVALIGCMVATMLVLTRGRSRAAWAVVVPAGLSVVTFTSVDPLREIFHTSALLPAQWLLVLVPAVAAALGSHWLNEIRDVPVKSANGMSPDCVVSRHPTV